VVGHAKCIAEDRNRRLQNVPALIGENGSNSNAGGRLELGHVQRPQSESPRSNPRFTSEGMEEAAHSARVEHSSPNGETLLGGGFKIYRHFDPRLGRGIGFKVYPISISGSESVIGREPAGSIAGRLGRKSWREPFEATINSKMEAGLSAQRIYQDLAEENRFAGSYQSVCRFVRRLKAKATDAGLAHRMPALGKRCRLISGLGAPIEQEGARYAAAGCCGPC
jgi:hypothetical protein